MGMMIAMVRIEKMMRGMRISEGRSIWKFRLMLYIEAAMLPIRLNARRMEMKDPKPPKGESVATRTPPTE